MIDDFIVFFEKKMSYKERAIDGIIGLILSCILLEYMCKTSMNIYGFSYFTLCSYAFIIICVLVSPIYRDRVYISYLSQSGRYYAIKYSIYDKEYYLRDIPVEQVKFIITTPWYVTMMPFYRMEIHINGKKLLTQKRIGEWNKEKFDEIIKYQKSYILS